MNLKTIYGQMSSATTLAGRLLSVDPDGVAPVREFISKVVPLSLVRPVLHARETVKMTGQN